MLSLVGLVKRFGDVVALDGLGFDAPPGRIVGFLGPNGAGKTTAMRCVFGLVRPDAGEVRWDGGPVGPSVWRHFGYMPEERGLYPKMKVVDQLAYLAGLSGMSRAKARAAAGEWLERLGLADRATTPVDRLSHGNQQRVQLAAALVHDPAMLVLDEPFSGLDPIGIEVMAAMLAELAAGGTGIIFSSHQLDLVEDVCQDVVIIDDGRVVLAGVVGELKERSPIRHLEVSVDGRAWLPAMGGLEPLPAHRGRSRFLVQRSTRLDAVLEAALAAGDLTHFSYQPPTLSDLFREAVGR